jgi:Uma2 family endonuclease
VVVDIAKPEIEMQLHDVYRFSLDEYHQLIAAGGFEEDARVELIEGLLLNMSPKTAEHENAIAWLSERLHAVVDQSRLQVRVAAALTLEQSEPEPDLMVIDRAAPRPHHPGTAPLVIEVAVSSLRRDLRQKPIVYARAGIPLYWVIDIDGRRAIVHSQPGPDGYGRIVTCGADGALLAPEIGIEPIALADVLAATGL